MVNLGSVEPGVPGLNWHPQFLAMIEAKPFSLFDLLLLLAQKKRFFPSFMPEPVESSVNFEMFFWHHHFHQKTNEIFLRISVLASKL